MYFSNERIRICLNAGFNRIDIDEVKIKIIGQIGLSYLINQLKK